MKIRPSRWLVAAVEDIVNDWIVLKGTQGLIKLGIFLVVVAALCMSASHIQKTTPKPTPTSNPWKVVETAGTATAQAQQPQNTPAAPRMQVADFADAVISGPETLVSDSTSCTVNNGILTLIVKGRQLSITGTSELSFLVTDVDIDGRDNNHDGWVTIPALSLGVKFNSLEGWRVTGCK